MALSTEAKEARNRYLREKYRKDPAYREKQKKRNEKYWEKKAQEYARRDETKGEKDHE